VPFIPDERGGVKDTQGLISVFRSIRDLPHGKARYSIKWKGRNTRSVLADEAISEENGTYSVAIRKSELIRCVYPEADRQQDADELISLLTGAIYHIWKDRYGSLFEKRGIRHVVHFQEEEP
jgi:hypothetical protein